MKLFLAVTADRPNISNSKNNYLMNEAKEKNYPSTPKDLRASCGANGR